MDAVWPGHLTESPVGRTCCITHCNDEGFSTENGELNESLHTSLSTDLVTTAVKRDLRLHSVVHKWIFSGIWDTQKHTICQLLIPKKCPVLDPPFSKECLVCSRACYAELSAYMGAIESNT